MNHHIYLARFTVETAGPLAIGSGSRGVNVDRLVARDANGLPYLPGTSLAGVLRHELTARGVDTDALFGCGDSKKDKKTGHGSRVILSSGHLLDEGGKVADGIYRIKSEYLKSFQHLPERDHVRLDHRGTAVKRGKFEEQLVPKGARFVFDLTLEGIADDAGAWWQLLEVVQHPLFRLGSGTRNGFGKIEVVQCRTRTFDLTQPQDLSDYLAMESDLNADLPGGQDFEEKTFDSPARWRRYRVTLRARDTFLFGSGLGDENVQQRPKREQVITWNGDQPSISEQDKGFLLFPATSLKGALSHRVAYHYNRFSGNYLETRKARPVPVLSKDEVVEELLAGFELSDTDDQAELGRQIEQLKALQANPKIEETAAYKKYQQELTDYKKNPMEDLSVGENNPAVRQLFGYAVEREEEEKAQRGHVIFSDFYFKRSSTQTFSHVSIDRFTGGALPGALFNEEVAATREEIEIDIWVHEEGFRYDADNSTGMLAENEKGSNNIRKAFEAALSDLTEGRLPLGGNTAKGHGVFTGSWKTATKNSDSCA